MAQDSILPKKTLEYINRKHPILEGDRNNQLFEAACQLRDAGYTDDEAGAILYDCAVGLDGLPNREFRATLKSVFKKTARPSVRHRYQDPDAPKLNTGNGNGNGSKPKTLTPMPAADYKLDPETPLPDQILQNPAIQYIQALFRPGEGISITKIKADEEGEKIVCGAGDVLSYEKWIEKFKDGLLDRWSGERNRGGAYVRINPTSGSDDEDVTDFRHVLVEFDKISIPEQWDLIQKSNIPCAAVSHSGKKSLHAAVIVSAKNLQEFEARVRIIFNYFRNFKVDTQNNNPSRNTRLPGIQRDDIEFGIHTGEQALLALRIGANSWEEWVKEKKIDESATSPPGATPAIHFNKISEGLAEFPKLNDPIVFGLLRRGETLNEISSPKAGKTLLAHDMAISVALGLPFLGMATKPCKVWILDNELHIPTIFHRLKSVLDAKGLKITDCDDKIRITPLRGRLMDIYSLKDIFEQAKDDGYGIIILDSLYRFYPNKFDENNNADMAKLYNTIDSYAGLLNAAFVLIHHTSRGLQFGKATTDRGAGAGAQSRACDSHMTLVPHPDEANVFILEAAVRSWPPIEPFCVKKEYPLLVPVPDIEVPDQPAGTGGGGGSGGAWLQPRPQNDLYSKEGGEVCPDPGSYPLHGGPARSQRSCCLGSPDHGWRA